jgi:hypothetical protein
MRCRRLELATKPRLTFALVHPSLPRVGQVRDRNRSLWLAQMSATATGLPVRDAPARCAVSSAGPGGMLPALTEEHWGTAMRRRSARIAQVARPIVEPLRQ